MLVCTHICIYACHLMGLVFLKKKCIKKGFLSHFEIRKKGWFVQHSSPAMFLLNYFTMDPSVHTAPLRWKGRASQPPAATLIPVFASAGHAGRASSGGERPLLPRRLLPPHPRQGGDRHRPARWGDGCTADEMGMTCDRLGPCISAHT